MNTSLFVIGFTLLGFVLAGDKEKMAEMKKNARECLAESKADIKVCKELWDDGIDDTQKKYMPCKCVMSCMSKKCGAMDANGVFQKDKIEEHSKAISNPETKKEAERVYKECFDSVGDKKDCEAAYALTKCVFTKSEMAKSLGKAMEDQMTKKE